MHVGTDELECWFLTGSQHLYGEETLRQVAAQSAEVVAALDGAAGDPGEDRLQTGADRLGGDPRACAFRPTPPRTASA